MNREFLEGFINIYESEPCLWQIKNKSYHDKIKRDAAYERLIEKVKTIDPSNACKNNIVKRINNIRSAYRKENKKVKASQKSGAGTDEVYEPKLWYYKLLRFLDDQDTPRCSRSNVGNDEDDINSNHEGNDEFGVSRVNSVFDTFIDEDTMCAEIVEAGTGQSTSTVTPQRRPQNKKRRQETQSPSLADEVLLTVKEHFNTPRAADDRFDIFGKAVAIKLRNLPKQQMLIAKKRINDILFQAEMGNLTLPYSPASSHSHSPIRTYSTPSTSMQPQQQYPQPQTRVYHNRSLTTRQQDQPLQLDADYFAEFDA